MEEKTEIKSSKKELEIFSILKDFSAEHNQPWAFIIGLCFVVIFFSLFNINGFNKILVSRDQAAVVKPVKLPFFLSASSFNNNNELTAVNGEIVVGGKTLPKTVVALFSDIDEVLVESNADGSFEETLLVDEDGGLVRITAFSSEGKEKTLTYNIFVADDVLGKTDKKITPGQANKPTVAPIQVEPVETNSAFPGLTKNQTEQVTEFLEVELQERTKTKEEAKIGPAKIKEIVSLGSTDSAQFREEAKIRVQKMTTVLANLADPLNRRAVYGVITEISGDSFVVTHQIQRDRSWTVFFNAETDITSKSEGLSVGMRVIAVGKPVGYSLLANKIHIIPGKAIGVFTKNPVSTEIATPTVEPTTTPEE